MKIKNLFKGLLALAMFLSSGVLFAQTFVITPTSGVESIDTVTVGSKMAYAIHPDNTITSWVNAGVFYRSGFNWAFSNGLAVLSATDGTPTDSTYHTITGYYADTLIHVKMVSPTVVVGTSFSVSLSEQSRPKSGTGCTGSTSTLNILPVAVPTLAWVTTDTGYCGTAAATDVNVSLTGYGPWDITYTINGNARTQTIGTAANRAAASLKLTIAAADLTVTSTTGNIVLLTNVTDRFSRKSLDLTLVPGTVSSTQLKIYNYPTPTTNPVQHLKNL
jgi:hypothetical protein